MALAVAGAAGVGIAIHGKRLSPAMLEFSGVGAPLK